MGISGSCFLKKTRLARSCWFCTYCCIHVCMCVWKRETLFPLYFTFLLNSLALSSQPNRSAQCSKPSFFLNVLWREAKDRRDRSFWCPSWEGGYRLHVPTKRCQRSYLRGQNIPTPAYSLLIAATLLDTWGSSQKTQCNRKSIFVNLSANRATY